ncbi:tryptophan permease [Shewanella sp. SM101]|uniref:tryptophan permease n=1 Tax=unclassified Shewanella TaxID=196818 RepID=UPI0021D8B3EE|nr:MULTISPECIES: tryptophan permease [unclassified Shewanella]MCU7999774.1 tryptophan permease [Shewanella sp. SM95]MCU8070630.1 tryptophan permease [Shewanella sp. SM32]MCU8091306.1 tryptophan permease [Shewanella sp. SM20]MCU8105106.1 tryptophan permease [Shewanella sp. SM101]
MANHMNAAKHKPAGKSLLGGAMIIAGTTVGAGMFSLPVVGAGMWFGYSILMLLGIWFCMLMSGLLLLETNLHFEPGASFDTLSKQTLGQFWRIVNGVSIAFVLYILTYAYISGGGSIVNHSLQGMGIELPQSVAGLVFAIVLASIVLISTKAVDRITTIMLGGMIITFFLAIGNLLIEIDVTKLLEPDGNNSFSPYLWAALPFGLASFGYHGNVPSLVKYYGKDSSTIIKAIFVGTFIALVIYACWLAATMGNIPRSQFIDIIAQGGNMGVLVGALSEVMASSWLNSMLTLFANLAVASSFLGVTLGLFDYLADLFGFDDSRSGRMKTALVTFVPPTILGLLFPDGFLVAIGFAALAATVWAVIVPALMAYKSRQLFPDSTGFRVIGGTPLIILVVLFGIVTGACHLLAMANLLPQYS